MRTHILAVFIFSLSISVPAAELQVFFGNLHSHTSYSDGSGTPDEAYRFAKRRGKLDFLAITEHNHKAAETSAVERNHDSIAHNPRLYKGMSSSLVETANRHTRPGEFVALYGQEFSTISGGNHVNIFDVDEVINESAVPSKQFDRLVSWLGAHKDSQGHDAIIQFNHPKKQQRDEGIEYGADDFGTIQKWKLEMGRHARLISVANGPSHDPDHELSTEYHSEESYRHYLNLGFKLAPTADQDTHYKNWGLATRSRTGVIADELTKPKLLSALRNRNVFATQDKNLRVVFFVGGQLMGTIVTNLPSLGSDLKIEYAIWDDDEPDAAYRIQIFSDKVGGDPGGKLPLTVFCEGTNWVHNLRPIEEVAYTGEGQYVWFKVIQENEDGDDDIAWTSPVWFERAITTPIEVAVAEVTAYVASKNSPIYHLSATCRSAQRIAIPNLLHGLAAQSGRQAHEGCPRH
jgi:hypothetical protein